MRFFLKRSIVSHGGEAFFERALWRWGILNKFSKTMQGNLDKDLFCGLLPEVSFAKLLKVFGEYSWNSGAKCGGTSSLFSLTLIRVEAFRGK